MDQLNFSTYISSKDDTKLSQESSRILTAHQCPDPDGDRIEIVVGADKNRYQTTIPAAALHLLIDALKQMAHGNSVSLTPIHAELTTQEAADLLNVSRSFLIEKIESGELPHHNLGQHCRINFSDLMRL
jgi:excisionase family DNA binding protein